MEFDDVSRINITDVSLCAKQKFKWNVFGKQPVISVLFCVNRKFKVTRRLLLKQKTTIDKQQLLAPKKYFHIELSLKMISIRRCVEFSV
jgi:hypothetical protein